MSVHRITRAEEARALIREHFPHPLDVQIDQLYRVNIPAKQWLDENVGPNGIRLIGKDKTNRWDMYEIDTEARWLLRLGRFHFRDENTAFEFKMRFG